MDNKNSRMGLLNLVWILIFLYFGFRLTFQGFERINFGAWDNIFGVVLILTAVFGIYCLVRDTAVGLAVLRGRLASLKRLFASKKAPKPPREKHAAVKRPAVAAVGPERRDMRYRPVDQPKTPGYVSETDIHSIDLESILAAEEESEENDQD